MERTATIKDLQFDPKKRATTDMKKAFEKILVDEFTNQTTTLNSLKAKAESEFLDKWKKAKGIDKLLREYEAKRSALKSLEERIENAGFNASNGNRIDWGKQPEDLQQALKAELKPYSQPRTELNELKSLIWSSDTVGDLLTLIGGVTKNGIIPKYSVAQVSKPKQIEA